MAADDDAPILRIHERLNALKRGREAALGEVQAEIARERALAHTRAVEKVDRAWLMMIEAERALDRPDGDRAARFADYEKARAAALHARWELEVHREAMGLHAPSDIDRDYPIPPRRR
ncbi:MAG: hypothetical protein ACK4YP_26725 [Myxococcota bacterium]